MIHTIGKLLFLNIHKNELEKLLKQKSKFWKIKDFGGEIHKKCTNISDTGKTVIRYYYCLVASGCIFFDIQPFSTGALPTACYVPQGYFTALTVVLCYCNELNATFRGVFLIQFVISIASASVSVFIFMQPGAWTNRIKCVIYFLFQIIDSAFYCVPLEFAVNAASQVGDAIYKSKWYEIDVVELKKCLSLVLIRTQKAVIFSGYGIIWINLKTFVSICKTIFSFYTYLNSATKINQ
ncbi:odorant receptor 47a-like [Tenebrio molitor]|uniref:odorant receptor 47a-like n=1 Tax=Tenebrio molitor TaxID=7067 RepID=UPI0036249A83